MYEGPMIGRFTLLRTMSFLAVFGCRHPGTHLGLPPESITVDVSAEDPVEPECGYDSSGPVPDVEVAICLAAQRGLPVADALHIWTTEYPQGWRIYAILEAECKTPSASGHYTVVMRADGRILLDIIYDYQEDNPPDLDCWSQDPWL